MENLLKDKKYSFQIAELGLFCRAIILEYSNKSIVNVLVE